MEYDCEIVYPADDFCVVRVGSFIVLLSKFGFATTGTKADWDQCIKDLDYASECLDHDWAKMDLPTNPQNSPGHDELVIAAVNCARANHVRCLE